MYRLFNLKAARIFAVFVAIICHVYSPFIQAQILDDVLVKQKEQGYEIE
ncbi:MAG: hypothetical protein ACI88A_002874, partial [Paraglaciecola sp.]